MNIYVETNFIQELSFSQQQAESCEKILDICEQGKSKLITPAFSLLEPLDKLYRQKSRREELRQQLEVEKNHFKRNAGYKTQIQEVEKIRSFLAQSIEEEKDRYNSSKLRIINIAEIIGLDAPIFLEADKCEQIYGLSPQDAIVLASVLAHLKSDFSQPSCFLNRNSRDFNIPQIKTLLQGLNCKMLSRFDDGYNFISSRIKA